jgi:hypothetical protein
MTRFLVTAFLIAHGLVHLAIYATPANPKAAPFDPGHSWAFGDSRAVASSTRGASVALACAVAAAYSTAGWMVAIHSAGWGQVATHAAALGLLLKGLWFHPWLSLGVGLDIAIAGAAIFGWPASL